MKYIRPIHGNTRRFLLLSGANLVLAFFLFSFNMFSQKEDRRIWDSPFGEDRFVISFNNDRWIGADEVEQRDVSLGFDAQVYWDWKFGTSPISFAAGIGISSHNVHHNGFFAKDTVEGREMTVLEAFPQNYNYRKNKHSVTFIEVPLEFRIRTRGPNQFKLFLGGKVGYLVNYHYKIDDDEGKRKFYDLDGINPIRYGVTARIGYNSWNIFGFYSLTPFIQDGKGDEIIPYSIGLSFFLL